MITILTYHEIVASSFQGELQHFQLSEKLLREHVETLLGLGLVAPDPGRLRDPDRLGSASFFLTFDDGHQHHADFTAPFLASRGIRGIFFVPTQRIGRPGYLRREDVQTMSQAGHHFGLHGHQHRRLDALPATELSIDFARSCEILGELTGVVPSIFAPVGGYGSDLVTQVAQKHGVCTIRTMRWGLNHQPNPWSLETIPMNHDFGSPNLRAVLESGRFGRGYRTKEMIKGLLPEAWYNRFRQSAPRIAKNLRLP